MSLTFVTAYLKIYEDEYDLTKTFEKRLELFLKLADTGINICIFTSFEFKEIFEEICKKYINVKLIQICSIDELEITLISKSVNELCNLPDRRSNIKDKHNYMFLMNSKIEFVKKTIDINPFSTEVFCWMDFSLPYIFKDTDKTIQKIKIMSQRNYINSFLTMPGCWNFKVNDINCIKNAICWRFCGGFFIGDKQTLINFYNLSIDNFIEFLKQTNKLLWEVNYWAWLEANTDFHPIWYPGDHNDSIINTPQYIYTIKITDLTNDITTYNYPQIETNDKFFYASASYIYDKNNNKHILNTRCVNYFYKDNWECDFFNPTRQIKTINIFSELDNSFNPISFDIMNVDESNLINNVASFSIGLEDIRLYNDNGIIKFIASNVNYNNQGKNRMIIGNYNYNNNICSQNSIVNMIWDTKCEKNWAPIQYNNEEKQLFIYQWNPYQIGFIDNDNNFQIHIENKFNNEFINKFRGSTSFIEYNDENLIGLVHYSIPDRPPTYYHCIVLIDKTTLLPVIYSDPFKFGDKPIEFCIGFTIYENKYLFWISQMDREPLLIKIDIDNIPILNQIY